MDLRQRLGSSTPTTQSLRSSSFVMLTSYYLYCHLLFVIFYIFVCLSEPLSLFWDVMIISCHDMVALLTMLTLLSSRHSYILLCHSLLSIQNGISFPTILSHSARLAVVTRCRALY